LGRREKSTRERGEWEEIHDDQISKEWNGDPLTSRSVGIGGGNRATMDGKVSSKNQPEEGKEVKEATFWGQKDHFLEIDLSRISENELRPRVFKNRVVGGGNF